MKGIRVATGASGEVTVVPGQRVLATATAVPSLAAHRALWPVPPARTAAELSALLDATYLAGRGGAGFPFARKVSTAVEAGRRRELVVNAAEGEPASAKDSALLLTVPHLVLDGAELVARALGVRTVHLVTRPAVERAARRAARERSGGPEIRVHASSGRYVGGQERAVLELVEGRANLPVTAWQPAAVRGLRGRPTVVSNAETYAQVAALATLGTGGFAALGVPEEPGTTLLTVAARHGTTVLEAPFGVRVADVLAYVGLPAGPLLLGGYQGAWLTADEVAGIRLLTSELRTVGASPGAGVLLPLSPGDCPVRATARIVAQLAGQSAGRCGPCRLGLPELARATGALADGEETVGELQELAALVTGRGACAHPDGTARLVRSLLDAFPDEVAAHAAGGCVAERVRV